MNTKYQTQININSDDSDELKKRKRILLFRQLGDSLANLSGDSFFVDIKVKEYKDVIRLIWSINREKKEIRILK